MLKKLENLSTKTVTKQSESWQTQLGSVTEFAQEILTGQLNMRSIAAKSVP
jgi:hypothetical protein